LEAEAKLKRIMAELSNLEGQSAKRQKAMGRIAARKRQIDHWMREEALRAIEIHEKGCPRLSVSSAGPRYRVGRRGARGGVALTA